MGAPPGRASFIQRSRSKNTPALQPRQIRATTLCKAEKSFGLHDSAGILRQASAVRDLPYLVLHEFEIEVEKIRDISRKIRQSDTLFW